MNTLKQFVQLRTQLTKEKADLEAKLREIESALGGEVAAPVTGVPGKLKLPTSRKKPGRKQAKNTLSVREGIHKLTKDKPLTKKEIIAGLLGLGWKTTSKRPENLLNPLLYGKKSKFKRKDGKFSPA